MSTPVLIPLAFEADLPHAMRRGGWRTAAQFGRLWGVSKATVYRWAAAGWITGHVYRYAERPGAPMIFGLDARPNASKPKRVTHRMANSLDPYGDLPFPNTKERTT